MIKQEITSMTGILLGRGPLHIPAGTPTMFLAEEYRDKPKKRETKAHVRPEHNMIQTERENRARVLAVINKKASTTSEIMEEVNLSRSAIHNLTNTLVDAGAIRRNRSIWPWVYEAIKTRKAKP